MTEGQSLEDVLEALKKTKKEMEDFKAVVDSPTFKDIISKKYIDERLEYLPTDIAMGSGEKKEAAIELMGGLIRLKKYIQEWTDVKSMEEAILEVEQEIENAASQTEEEE